MNSAKKKALIKRIADVLEKMSIASFAIGIFQGNTLGIWIGIVCLALSLVVTYKEA